MHLISTCQRPPPMLTAAAAPTTRSVKIINPCADALQRRGRVSMCYHNAFKSARHAMQCHAAAAMVDHSSEVRALLESTNQQWLEHSLENKLTDAETGVTVVLLGVCFYAPMQQQLVQSALQQISPEYIAMEQPLETSSTVLLPHPVWIQTLFDSQDVIADGINNFEQPTAATLPQAAVAGPLQKLQQQLQHAGHPQAAVGRTIIDPWETFGFYAGLDLYKQPAAVVSVLQLCGFLPGHELLVAARHAMQTGATLSSIDAPLKLQEGWVKQLLQNFALDEQQVNAYQPAKDLEANQQLLPAAAAAWDRQLAATARQLQQEVQSGSAAAVQDGAAAAAAASSASTLEQQELLLFQVSKATAAGTLSPAAAHEAAQRLQRLQPLKWAHFALRQRYMARQIKELCATAAKASGRQPEVAVRQQQQQGQPESAATSSTKSSLNKQATGVNPAGTPAKAVTVLVVVGRQHVHGLESMWKNPSSSLWRDRMPKSFAPSTVERPEDAGSKVPGAADVKADNWRPTGSA